MRGLLNVDFNRRVDRHSYIESAICNDAEYTVDDNVVDTFFENYIHIYVYIFPRFSKKEHENKNNM